MPRVEENSLPDIMTNLLNELFDVFPVGVSESQRLHLFSGRVRHVSLQAPFDVEASDAFDGHFQSSLAERSSYPPGFGPMHPGSPAIEESKLGASSVLLRPVPMQFYAQPDRVVFKIHYIGTFLFSFFVDLGV